MTETKTETKVRVEHPMTLRVPKAGFAVDDDDWLFEFCRINDELRIERTAEGNLKIEMPTGGETSNRNFELTTQLGIWTRRDGTGKGFDSNGGFILPNGALRAPDASWVSRDRLSNLTAGQKRKFLPLCPDFAVELRSPSDALEKIEAKMREYIENGARLAWLLDPEERKAHIYKADGSVEILDNPESLSGAPELPGFTLELKSVWEPEF
ncbi:MAG: Uma2 family endonuclease [Actinomycetota bacterium]|jgi:Uma2 family endonuclease|nr:Uma2 family endonuclease [Rubrobacter sp.]MDQ3509529.1 Uma2 family endonuclease [Actinomycetota bacterium]